MAGEVVPFPNPVARPEAEGGMMGQTNGNAAIAVQTEDGSQVQVNDDGTVVIELGAPAVHIRGDEDEGFGDNLAELLPDNVLASIADEVLQGVESDNLTRAELIENYNAGLDLLGIKLEEAGQRAGDRKGVSKVGHPLMTEAMVKYWAGAIAELLPADGPCKVETFGRSTGEEDTRAGDFESDFNYFLTRIAKEYYPDTARMLMQQAYCGNAYKKIYRDPMRDRPVSESVSMIDLIVSEEATDLESATRVTHQFFPSRGQLRRMQLVGRYKDIDLGQPMSMLPSANRAIKQMEGVAPISLRPQDLPYHFYETDTDIDTDYHGLLAKWEYDAPEGLPLPYKITLDKDSRQVVGIWRNWKDGDELYRKRNMYVRYGMVNSIGYFHDWGFLQLLGNQTKALRSIWRLLIDAGMFSNFPGGVKAKGLRASTNEINPGPGEFVDIDLPPNITDIRQAIMGMPYKQIDATFIQFAGMVQESAERLGGTVQMEVGEGRTNVPVGTMMSMIEQATQIMAAVHKGNHRSQEEELVKLRELFAENPADLTKLARNPKRRWEVADEFMDLNLGPATDPNIPAQVHRIQQMVALMEIIKNSPQMFDIRAALERVLTTIRIKDVDKLLITPEQAAQASQGGGVPTDPNKMAELQAKQKMESDKSQQRAAEMQQKAALEKANADQKMAALQQKAQLDAVRAQRDVAEHQQEVADAERERQIDAQTAALDSADRAADRRSHLTIAQLKEETTRLKIQEQQEKNKHDAAMSQQESEQARMKMAADQHNAEADRAQSAQDSAQSAQASERDHALALHQSATSSAEAEAERQHVGEMADQERQHSGLQADRDRKAAADQSKQDAAAKEKAAKAAARAKPGIGTKPGIGSKKS